MRKELSKAAGALKEEIRARQTKDQAISKLLEEVGTGGIHISAMGAFWLFLAVILSSGSVERSDEHTSELQSLMRISYAVFCWTNTKTRPVTAQTPQISRCSNNACI